MHAQPFSLYLHIPFCIHRCAYCDFNTYAGLDDLIPGYVQALCQEIQLASSSALSEGQRARAHTVFFGGGTPSLLPLDDLAKILGALRQAFDLLPESEISLEANPGTVERAYLSGLRAMGVNRLSLGMQSAHPDDLRLLERQHRLEEVVQAVAWARQAGFENLNLDLIFGIPHQSLDSWQRTLGMALSLRPEHLSLYALTLEHGTPMEHWVSRGLLPEPDSDLAADMYEYAMQRLEQAGYHQYEISNWARQDPAGGSLACRHNLQYWRDLPYLGFGAGAHGYAAGFRTVNVLSPAAYIQRLQEAGPSPAPFPSTPATTELVPIDRQAEMGELMMMGLRLVEEGVEEARFAQRFDQTLLQAYGAPIARLIGQGLLEWKTDPAGARALRLTRRGRLLGNRVFREFI